MENQKPKTKKCRLSTERQLAHEYYMSGMSQKDIAEKVGVSTQSVNKWVKEGRWENIRAARTITRRELVNKMLAQINEKLESKEWSPDEMVKATAAIEKLDKQTNVVTVIEVFSTFNKWIISRMQIDPELTPELVKFMNRYQDIFISEQLSSTKAQLI